MPGLFAVALFDSTSAALRAEKVVGERGIPASAIFGFPHHGDRDRFDLGGEKVEIVAPLGQPPGLAHLVRVR